MQSKTTRRQFMRVAGMGSAAAILAACQPKVVEKIVKETVVVKEEVEKVVKETVVVTEEKEVTKVVEVEKAAPATIRGYTFTGEKFTDSPQITYMAGMSPEQKRGFLDDAAWLKQATGIELIVEIGDDAKFNALLAAGTPPDLYYLDTPGIRAADGTWMPIDDYVDAEFLSRFPQVFIDGFTGLDGKLYSLQIGGWFPWAWVNTKLIQDAGATVPDTDWTWEQLVELGQKVTKDVNGNGPTDAAFDPEKVEIWGTWLGWFCDDLLCYSNGARRMDETGTKFLMDDPKVIEAWKFWADASCTHKIMPTASWMGAEGIGASEMFLNGRIAVYTDGINFDLCRRAEEELGSGNWKLVAFPHPKSHDLVLPRYQGGTGVTSASKNPAAAVEVLKFFATGASMWWPSLWLKDVDYVGYWEEVYPFLKEANFRETFEFSFQRVGPEPWHGTAAPFTVGRYTQGWDFWTEWNQVRDCKKPFEEFDFVGYTRFANEQVVAGMQKDIEQSQLLPAWREALLAIYEQRKSEL